MPEKPLLVKTKALAKLGNIVGQHSQISNVAQMLSSLANVSADKFIKKFVARMFEHNQAFFGNICCSAVCCPVWPHCRATIHLNFHLRKIHLRSDVLQNNMLNSIQIRWPVKV